MIKLEQVQNREHKKTITLTITREVSDRFDEIARELKINKSLLVEECIKEFLQEYGKEV